MSSVTSKNHVLIHAEPTTYIKGLSLIKLAHDLGDFSEAVNHPQRKVDDSLFVNINEDGVPHLTTRRGTNGRSFKTVDDAVAHVIKTKGEDIGVVVGCYDTKRGRLNGSKAATNAEIYDLPHIYNISGGIMPKEEHNGWFRLFKYFHTTCLIFSEALPSTRVSNSPVDSVFAAIGTDYFDQDFLHHFTALCNKMKYELLGPEQYQYRRARFCKLGNDPLTQVNEVFEIMCQKSDRNHAFGTIGFSGETGNPSIQADTIFRDTKKASKVLYRLFEISITLEEQQPQLQKVIEGLSLKNYK